MFGLAPQHLLLPALLETLLRVGPLVGQVCLPLRQRVKLLQRVFYVLFVLLLRRSSLRGFVLVLCGIKLQVKETGEVASRAAATSSATAAAALTEGHLNLAEGCLRAQQRL